MSARRLSYTTDLTDEEWHILEPMLPPEKAGGRPRRYPIREVMNGIQYVLRAGCAWRLMPHDLRHWQMAYQTFRAWRRDGTWQCLHDQLRNRLRTRMRRHPQASAAIIDAQTVKTTEKGGRTAMMAPRNSTAPNAISSLTRRVSCSVSSSTPPIRGMPRWRRSSWPQLMRSASGYRTSGPI
jgi:transposase